MLSKGICNIGDVHNHEHNKEHTEIENGQVRVPIFDFAKPEAKILCVSHLGDVVDDCVDLPRKPSVKNEAIELNGAKNGCGSEGRI